MYWNRVKSLSKILFSNKILLLQEFKDLVQFQLLIFLFVAVWTEKFLNLSSQNKKAQRKINIPSQFLNCFVNNLNRNYFEITLKRVISDSKLCLI